MDDKKKMIGLLVGSRRKGSFNRQLAVMAENLLQEKGQPTCMISWLDVPFFSQDDEFPAPAAVQAVREQISACDVLWIFSPEYNGQIPGAEKNLLDWLSRPMTKGGDKTDTPLYGKDVLLTSAGGRAAGGGVRRNLSLLCKFLGMNVISSEGVALSPESWGSDDLMKTPGVRELLEGQIQTLLG